MDPESEIEEGQPEEYETEDTQPIEEEEEVENFEDGEEAGYYEGEMNYSEVEGKEKRKKHRSSHEDEGERRESKKRRSREDHEDRHKSRRRSGELDGYDSKERRRSGGEHSDYEEGRSHRKRRSEDRERDGKSSRRKHHKHRKDKSKKSKSRLDDSRSSMEMEQEEGELEDGEIDEEEDFEDFHDQDHHRDESRYDRKKYERENSDRSEGNNKHEGNYGEEEEEGGESEEETYRRNDPRKGRNRDRQRESRRNPRGRGRRDDRRGGRVGRGGRKGPGHYHDYDSVNDDSQAWMSKNKRSPGRHRSPAGNHRHRDKYDRDKFDEGPFDSPPGPYDSPSDEDSQDEYGERRGKSKKSQSMLSMLGNDMLDPNIAVEEGQDLYQKKKMKKKVGEPGGGRFENRDRNRDRDRGDRGSKRKQNKDYGEEYSEQPKKKPLLQTPMEERPICRFFKEGKCQKGYDCPFNHDTIPDKKPELCKYYLTSYCSKGDHCIFMHSEFPCKFYHTGQECYGGDDCKFSHDPLTDETRHLIEKKMDDDERHQSKRPSLLGSPPRHLKMDPEMQERIKKIPSIFDIEVFPPGQSPKKPPSQQGGPGPQGPPNRMQGPPQNMMGPPQRPSGFYNEMNQGRMPGPGMMGPPVSGAGPGMMGPPVSGPGPMGPPGQRGPPPMHMGPPMGPPGPMNQGPMGPPGPRGPMGPPGPMNQMNPALNPAVAFVGALLQHAAGANRPPMGPQGINPGMMGPPGPMPGPSMQQGPPVSQDGFGPNFYQENGGFPQQQDFNPDQAAGVEGQTDNEQNNLGVKQDQAEEGTKKLEDPNKEKLAMMGLDPDTLSNLPSKQKELFLRIQGNKALGEESPKQEDGVDPDPTAKVKKESNNEEAVKQGKDDADDDWYSSDEDEAKDSKPKPKLTDILKNLNKHASTPESPQNATPPSTSTSTLNIMQMINAIKTNAGSNTATSPIGSPTSMPRDPRQRFDPRSGKPGGPAIIPIDGPESKVEPPTFINSYEGDIPVYRLIPVSKEPPKMPPPGLNLDDAQFKNDPRVQKMLKRVEATRGQSLESSGSVDVVKNTAKENKPVDPRTGMLMGSTDPRVKPASDPRLQRTVSETGGVKPQDPRIPRVPSNPLIGQNPSVSDPRLGRQVPPSGPPDPRMLGRQVSREGPLDPRLGRQLSNPPTSNFDNPNMNRSSEFKPSDPRFAPQGGATSDPRKLNRPNPSQDPRSISRQNSQSDPRPQAQIDPKLDLLTTDPRLKPDMDISALKPLDPKIIQSSLEESSEAVASQLGMTTSEVENVTENNNDQTGSSELSDKPKLDYRNDPRFKRKPAGKRKSSMDYASPLGDDGGQDSPSGYSAYTRPQAPNQRPVKQEPKTKSDPRLTSASVELKTLTSAANEGFSPQQSSEQSSVLNLPIPELPPFIPPPEPEINTKDFFKTMDPTASPFC